MRFPGIIFIAAGFVFAFSSLPANAQRPDRPNFDRGQSPGPQRGPRDEGRSGAGDRQGDRRAPWVEIFDTDQDGELSESEIANASVALLKMDRNKDGKVSGSELRPGGGRQQQNGRGGAQGREGGETRGRGAGGSAEQAGGRRGGSAEQEDADFATQLMSLDGNSNGLIERDELPDHIRAAFEIADVDQSDGLTQKELLVLASKFRRRELSPESGQTIKNAPAKMKR